MSKKKAVIHVSSNAWEYSDTVTIKYNDSIEFKIEDEKYPMLDSLGHPTPNVVIVDGVEIIFEEGFEEDKDNV